MILDMKMPRDVESFRLDLRDLGGEFWTTVLLEKVGDSKSGNNCPEKVGECMSPFYSGGEHFHPV